MSLHKLDIIYVNLPLLKINNIYEDYRNFDS